MPRRRSFFEWARYNIIAITSVIVGVGGAIAAASHIEPYLAAHRGYVRNQVAQASQLPILRDIQIETAEGKRDAAARDKRTLTKDLNAIADPAYRERIERDLDNTQTSIDRLNQQIQTLRELKSQGK